MRSLRPLLRKRTTYLLFAILILIGACSDDDHHVVQVVNDDLEGGNSWQFVNMAPALHTGKLDNSVSASASHSLSTKSNETQVDGFSFWSLHFDPSSIPVGASLELSVKVKVTDVTGSGAFIAIRGDDNSNVVFFETTQGKQTIAGTADFATYTVKLDSYPEGVKYMYIFLVVHGTTTGSVNFDDISLVSNHH